MAVLCLVLSEYKNAPKTPASSHFSPAFFGLYQPSSQSQGVASAYESAVTPHSNVSIIGQPFPKSASLSTPAWCSSRALQPIHLATLSRSDYSRECCHDHYHDGCAPVHEEAFDEEHELGRL